jgi:hypothetical protein
MTNAVTIVSAQWWGPNFWPECHFHSNDDAIAPTRSLIVKDSNIAFCSEKRLRSHSDMHSSVVRRERITRTTAEKAQWGKKILPTATKFRVSNHDACPNKQRGGTCHGYTSVIFLSPPTM